MPESREELSRTILTLQEELAQTNHEVAALALELERRVDDLAQANTALRAEIEERLKAEREREGLHQTLQGAYSELRRLTGILRMLSEINSLVLRTRDHHELLRGACRLAVTLGGYSSAIVLLRDAKSHLMQPVAAYGEDRETAQRVCELIGQRIAAGMNAGISRPEAMQVLVFTQAEYRPSSESAGGLPKGPPMVGLPLTVDSTLVGFISICSKRPDPVAEEEMRILQEMAANIAFALQYLQQDRRVRLLSYFDILTGLAKRKLFCERLGSLLGAAVTLEMWYKVTVFDIENLSAVNDSFGRHAGDVLLQLLADRLKRRFQDTSLLAHFGGGTFAVVQAVTTTAGADDTVNAHLDTLCSQAFVLDGKEVPIAARSGVAFYPKDARDPEGLVQKAEAALRTAKLAKQRHGDYSERKHAERLARVALERKLRVALERREFQLHYQPKVSVKNRRIEGVEALIRWTDPDLGPVSPGKFLPILEESGLIFEAGDWVIERAAADCRHWQELGLPPVRVAVNVSPVQLQLSDFVSRFLKHTERWATGTAGLDMEITESALVEESSIRKLELLRATGVHVAIDDFGTGYSSLSRLAHLPIDTLKIDRSFVSQITLEPRGRKLVAIIISIARAFRLPVVAEGVETQDQLDALWQLGCDQSQGYLHSRPVPGEEFADLLRNGKGRYILPRETEQVELRRDIRPS